MAKTSGLGSRCWLVSLTDTSFCPSLTVWADEVQVTERGDLFFWWTAPSGHRLLNIAMKYDSWDSIILSGEAGASAGVVAWNQLGEYGTSDERETPVVPEAPETPAVRPPYVGRAMREFIAKFSATCVYCLRQGTDAQDPDGRSWSRDHMQPRVAGGSDSPSNLVLACRACNSAKSDRSVEWMLARIEAKKAAGGAPTETITQVLARLERSAQRPGVEYTDRP